jgi:hypothetical protein
MESSALLFEELAPEVLSKASPSGDGPRVEPIRAPDGGPQDGLLVESALERVAVFRRRGTALSLEDITAFRRRMHQAQARRALLCVPADMPIANPVMLLATLSKIEIVRLAPVAHA